MTTDTSHDTDTCEKHFFSHNIDLSKEALRIFDKPLYASQKGQTPETTITSIDKISVQSKSTRVILAEYKTLREELLRRINMRQQIVQINLTLGSLILSYGLIQTLQNPSSNILSVALIFPPMGLLLGLGWIQMQRRIQIISAYIISNIESQILELNWETTMLQIRAGQEKKFGIYNSTVPSHGGVFIVTQLVAILIGLPFSIIYSIIYPPSGGANFKYLDFALIQLLIFDVVCVIYLIMNLIQLDKENNLITRDLSPSVPLVNP